MSVDATRFVWKLSKNDITPLEKLILLSIADRCGEAGECWPSLARLHNDTGIARRAIILHRNKLIEQGILRFTGEYRGRSKQIPVMQLMVDDWREGKSMADEYNDQCMPCTGAHDALVHKENKIDRCTGCTSDQCMTCTLNLKEKEPKRKDIKISCAFAEFWNIYPTKKGKKNCKEIWERRKLNSIASTIIESLKGQIEKDQEWKEGFIPHPKTYLNGDKWEDEIKMPKPKNEQLIIKQPTPIAPAVAYNTFVYDLKAMIKFNEIPSDTHIPKFEEWAHNNITGDAKQYIKDLKAKGVI